MREIYNRHIHKNTHVPHYADRAVLRGEDVAQFLTYHSGGKDVYRAANGGVNGSDVVQEANVDAEASFAR